MGSKIMPGRVLKSTIGLSPWGPPEWTDQQPGKDPLALAPGLAPRFPSL